jgi:hypothetical protein
VTLTVSALYGAGPLGPHSLHARARRNSQEGQPGRLRQAEYEIGSLDRLARRALGEVVFGCDREHGPGAHVEPNGDVRDVGAVRCAGAGRLVDDDDTRVVGIELAVVLEQARGRQPGRGRTRVTGGENAARGRHEVGREEYFHRCARNMRQRLLHLGGVTMRQQSVRRDVLVGFGEQARRLRGAPGAGDPRDRVGDDSVAFHQLLGHERREREAHRGRVATRDGDVVGARDLAAVQLHEPVHEFVDELRRGVRLAVPPPVGVRRQTEVGPEIDDVRAATEQIRDDQLRRTVREADERDVGAVHVGRVVRCVHEVAVGRPQRRVQVADRRARVRVGRDVPDLDCRVPGQQPQEFGARIA